MDMDALVICKNCSSSVTEGYCGHCGQPAKLKRIDKHYLTHEFTHLLHVEKGIIYTVRMLLTRPGEAIKTFIHEVRTKLVKPVPFLIFSSVLYTVIAHLFHADDLYSAEQKAIMNKTTIGAIQNWIQNHYGYANILSGVFYAISIKLFFRKQPFNFYEIVVMLCFIMGMQMILLTVLAFFFPLLGVKYFLLLVTVVSFVYPVWAIGDFYGRGKPLAYVKAFLAYLVGNLFWLLAIVIVGVVSTILIKGLGK
jgi:hypothetical protein